MAPFLGTLRNAFVGDDIVLLQEDRRVAAGAVKPFFLQPYWAGVHADPLYRPLVQTTYLLNYRLSRFRPASYHAMNLALHALVCLLLWALARRVGAGREAAFAAAAIFAVHPVHVEPVSQVVGRAELLAAVGVLAALLAHPAQDRRLARACLAAGLFLLALGSKENGAVFLGLAPLLDLARGARAGDAGRFLRKSLPVYAIYGFAAALYLVARSHALVGAEGPLTYESQNPIHDLSWDLRVQTALSVLGRAVRLLLFPVALLADYGPHCTRIVMTPTDPRFLFGLGAVAATVVVLLISHRRRSSAVGFGTAMAALAYAPVSNFLFPIGTIFAERLLYLPSAGVAIVGGCGIAALLRGGEVPTHRAKRIAARTLMVAVLGCLAALSVDRVRDWRDNLTLFLATVRVCPGSAFAHAGLGYVYLQRGQLQAAIGEYGAARELMPSESRLSYMLGVAHLRSGHVDQALVLFREALLKDPASLDAASAAAELLRARGDPAAAAQLYDRTLHEAGERERARRPRAE